MISIRHLSSCLSSLAILTNFTIAQAKTNSADLTCQTYLCMLNADFAKDAACQPLISNVLNIFPLGSYTVTCGDSSSDTPLMQVIHREAGKNFCRPDLRTQQGDCNATEAIDFSLQ